ncbi:MAG TPA: orotidine-5'-phosphate decarboxylase [Vitreimonas sp.]|uniref:orotidine-5'-phosphate decarboxylase n=1 Tax=Vitreimonas sp. TaxID=3069702 RepID=UPI002D397F32|nr:orotidine-5'-phosphate decarboxylase [Vitreimonas sp.]HYD89775.1 orotidine-5'-phosphate decarboxylase [Vitreimonas sp.]
MSAAYADRLIEKVRSKRTPLCVGLDPFADKVPALFGDLKNDAASVLVKFGTSLIDIAAKHAAVLKPQLGLFEQFGELGYAAARMLVEYGRAAGMIVLLDAKRGDIGTTAEGYARATIGARPGFDADCVTVNPYMGKDTLAPFVDMAKANGKGVAVLVRTSNPGAGDFQDLQVGGAPVWRRVAEMLAPETQTLMGASGWSGLMAVAGATYPEEARALREAMPHALFLVPGYGAQGASAKDALAGFVATAQGLEGGVVSSSRAVTYPPAAQTAKNMSEWRAAIDAAMAVAADELRTASAR